MTPPVEQRRRRDLRLDRRALRAERARVAWWRRLVRARLDLAVAQAAAPDGRSARTWRSSCRSTSASSSPPARPCSLRHGRAEVDVAAAS